MTKSIQKILLCLLSIVSLTKALRIRNGDRCLSCPGYVDILEGDVFTLEPFINDPTRFYSCTPNPSVVPREKFWTYTPNSNHNINLCIRNADACLGLMFKPNIAEHKIDLIAVIRKSNTTKSEQEWNYDGKKLTNVSLGPTYCAQAEKEFLKMVPCNDNEAKQKIEINNN